MLASADLASPIEGYLEGLCGFPDRYPGRPGNRAATELFARVVASQGLEVEVSEMDCLDFERGVTLLTVDGESFPATAGPLSNPAAARAPLVVASTIDELEAGPFDGKVLLLRGELCREPLTPKSFTYYEIPEHRRIVAALEAARPAAIVAATGRCPDLAGSLYPFPLLNDGEFEIPNAFLTDIEGERLAGHAGAVADLSLGSRRIQVRAQHVVARARGTGSGRIVVFGHINSWDGAPGALDNATGTAALLGLAHLLAGYEGQLTVELVPLNGEDYYGATGEKRFERDNEGRWDDIVLGMNVDASGWRGHGTEVSLFGLAESTERAVREAVSGRPAFTIGEPWYQSDHGLFLLHGRPAIAVISEDYAELAANVTHTSADALELADPGIVAEVSVFFADVIARMQPGL